MNDYYENPRRSTRIIRQKPKNYNENIMDMRMDEIYLFLAAMYIHAVQQPGEDEIHASARYSMQCSAYYERARKQFRIGGGNSSMIPTWCRAIRRFLKEKKEKQRVLYFHWVKHTLRGNALDYIMRWTPIPEEAQNNYLDNDELRAFLHNGTYYYRSNRNECWKATPDGGLGEWAGIYRPFIDVIVHAPEPKVEIIGKA